MTPTQLMTLAVAADRSTPCEACGPLRSPGWESMPGSFEQSRLERVGTLRAASDEEPTLEEYHPAGTNGWSVDAPIAPGFHPYNRCDVWRCRSCHRAYLRYTEFGGYYQDERVRELDAALVVEAG
ncbi:MAG: hypothetical protein CFE46_14710 [Burkholderiales bacterium PBB6]|nr:MAG: hypothetical protein CFE46_14710 [Burkholderiales bacterium PBB6]